MVNVCESGTLALTQQLNELHVPNIPTTVIEHTTNTSANSDFVPLGVAAATGAETRNNLTTTTVADPPPPYYATHNVIQSNSTSTVEEMWDDVL